MGDAIYKPLISDMTWSYSRIESFESCPYRWFMSYIHYPKPDKDDKFYASYGTFMHELLERYFIGEITKEKALRIYMSQFFDRMQVSGRPKESTVKKYFQDGVSYLKSLRPLEYEVVAIEDKIDFTVHDIPFVGKVDYIGLDKDGEFVIIDNKSRDLKPRSNRAKKTNNDKEIDKMLRQLYIYAEAVRQKYGKLPKKLCFNCFRTGILIEEPFVYESYLEALLWAKNTIEEISEISEFQPQMDYFYCNYICGVSGSCCYHEMMQRGRR